MASRDVYGRPPPSGGARAGDGEPALSRRSLLRLRLSRVARRDIDYDALTARLRSGWDRGGHEPLLRAIEPVAEVVADLAGIGPSQSVLDVGAGDGNLALAAAARGAEVEACDLSPRMVERGRTRTDDAVTWQVGDAAALPYPDASFDAVVSSFGASLAPRAIRTAHELARVARPGGVVAVAAWVPRGLPGRLDELLEPFGVLPEGVPRPGGWGVGEVVSRRLGSLFEGLQLRSRTVALRFESPDDLFDALVRPYPLDTSQRAELRPGFDRVLASCNNLPPRVEIDARFLVALAARPR